MSVPVAVVDALASLLESEQGSVFRFMGDGSPYLNKATADVRRPLAEMVEANARHGAQLAAAIEHLGGYPPPSPAIRADEQYLAYLSLKFLLPKLVEEKGLTIRRYENTLRAIRDVAAPDVVDLLKAQMAEHAAHEQVLRQKADEVIAAK